jgi:hypothetical protein
MRNQHICLALLTSALLLTACSSTPPTTRQRTHLPAWYVNSQKASKQEGVPQPATAHKDTMAAAATEPEKSTSSGKAASSGKTAPAQPSSAERKSAQSTVAHNITTHNITIHNTEPFPAKSTYSTTIPTTIPTTTATTTASSATSTTGLSTTASPTTATHALTASPSTGAASTSSVTAQPLTQPHHLEPFKASYRIYVSKIPMPITAELELRPLDQPDTWEMRFEVHSFMLHNLEESTFTWNNCHPKSIHYHHDFKGFGHHQFHDTNFYWNPPHVENHSDEDDKSFPIPADSVDDLTVLLQAACVFSEGRSSYHATSIYGDQIRDNLFTLLRHETIKTPLGPMDTLVIEKVRKEDNGRHTIFWIAPTLNYMLVKAKHIENPVLFGEVIMKSYEGPHLPVAK